MNDGKKTDPQDQIEDKNQTEETVSVDEPKIEEVSSDTNGEKIAGLEVIDINAKDDVTPSDSLEQTEEKNEEIEVAVSEKEKSEPETGQDEEAKTPTEEKSEEETKEDNKPADESSAEPAKITNPNAKWYVVHTFAGHENRVAQALKQRIEAEHLENQIFDILVPTQDKIEIRSGKKETVKEKIFPGYLLVKMDLGDISWLAVRTTPGVTSFVGMNNKPTPISELEVSSIVKFTTQGAAPTFKDVFMVDDTVKIIDGPFADFIGKVDSVDKEKGRVRVLVSIFGRETPVELDFLQVQKL